MATDRLHVASGSNAPLIAGLSVDTGSDLAFAATLGPDRVALANDDGSRTWLCFAPDPPMFPTYNLTSFGATDAGSFYFDVAVSPDRWAVGEVAIDGVGASVFVGDHGPGKGTIGARATAGTLRIIAAPTELGEACGFSIVAAPLALVE